MSLRHGRSTLAIVGLLLGPMSIPWAEAQQCVKMLEVSSSGEKLSMDPLDNTSHEDVMYLTGIYEPLVELDARFEPVPVLAERWESSADAKVWTFHLRRGVKFHNGKELDAQDVVFTFKRLIDPSMGSGAAATLSFLDPDGITAVDSHTVRFTTKRPVAELPVLVRNKYTVIVPAGSRREDLKRRGVGTGPFLQESFTLGAPYNELKRNPNYWRAGLPKAPCIRIAAVPDATARVAALSSGEGDIIPYVDVATLAAVKNNPRVKVARADGGTYWNLAMWVDTPPFNDVRVRTAMKIVVDRKAMVDLFLLGDGIQGNDSPMPPNSPWAYSAEVPKQDIARAKTLLAAAGHPNGLSSRPQHRRPHHPHHARPGLRRHGGASRASRSTSSRTPAPPTTPRWCRRWRSRSVDGRRGRRRRPCQSRTGKQRGREREPLVPRGL